MFSAGNRDSLRVYCADIWRCAQYDKLALPLLISAPNESADFYLFRLLSVLSVLPLNFPLLQQSFSVQHETLPFTLTQALKTNSVRYVRSAAAPLCRFGELDVENSRFVRIARDPASGAPTTQEFYVDRRLVQALIAMDTLWTQRYNERLQERNSGERTVLLQNYERNVRYMFALAHGNTVQSAFGAEEFLRPNTRIGFGLGPRLFGAAYSAERDYEEYAQAATACTLIKMAKHCGSASEELQRTMRVLQCAFAPALQGVMYAYDSQRVLTPQDTYACAAAIRRYYAQEASLCDLLRPDDELYPSSVAERAAVQPLHFLRVVELPLPPALASERDTDEMDVAINVVSHESLATRASTDADTLPWLRALRGHWEGSLYYYDVLKALGEKSFYDVIKLYNNALRLPSNALADPEQYAAAFGERRIALEEYMCACYATAKEPPVHALEKHAKVLEIVLQRLEPAKRAQLELLHSVNRYSAFAAKQLLEFPLPANPATLSAKQAAEFANAASTQNVPDFALRYPVQKEKRNMKRQLATDLLSAERAKRAAHNDSIMVRLMEVVVAPGVEPDGSTVLSSSSSDAPLLARLGEQRLGAEEIVELIALLSAQLERYGHALCLCEPYGLCFLLQEKVAQLKRPLSSSGEQFMGMIGQVPSAERTAYLSERMHGKVSVPIIALMLEHDHTAAVCVDGLARLLDSAELAQKVHAVFAGSYKNTSYRAELERPEVDAVLTRYFAAQCGEHRTLALAQLCDSTSVVAHSYAALTNDIRVLLTQLYNDTMLLRSSVGAALTRIYDVETPFADGTRAVHRALLVLVERMLQTPDLCGVFEPLTSTPYVHASFVDEEPPLSLPQTPEPSCCSLPQSPFSQLDTWRDEEHAHSFFADIQAINQQ